MQAESFLKNSEHLPLDRTESPGTMLSHSNTTDADAQRVSGFRIFWKSV